MSEEASAEVASFEAKWSAAHPEFGLALAFVRDDRSALSAFACLVFEIEHAAFGIREAQPAAVKLQWWAEEFARAARGEARHPLTQALADRLATAAVPTRVWHDVIVGALAQRDPEPPADTAALLDGYDTLYAPLATVESTLFGTDARAIAATLAQQEKTIEKMKQVLALMVKSEGYQEAVNLLYEIQKSQQDVLERTIKEQQERIKRILEGEKADPPKP